VEKKINANAKTAIIKESRQQEQKKEGDSRNGEN
jgi:hypothetical protein